ncbi:hypothetical protein C0J52_27359 [Blattella germanica]|nr:hypothetical protein C0J52_27359 [Blattella germanica]
MVYNFSSLNCTPIYPRLNPKLHRNDYIDTAYVIEDSDPFIECGHYAWNISLNILNIDNLLRNAEIDEVFAGTPPELVEAASMSSARVFKFRIPTFVSVPKSSSGSKINSPQSLTVPQNDTDYPSNGDDSSPGNDDVIGRELIWTSMKADNSAWLMYHTRSLKASSINLGSSAGVKEFSL